jgi:hypothetical protein
MTKIMANIIYFDVEKDEQEFLKNANDGKYDYILTEKSLNKLEKLPDNYRNAEIISVFTFERISVFSFVGILVCTAYAF